MARSYSIRVGPMVGPGIELCARRCQAGLVPALSWTRGHSLLSLMGRSDVSHLAPIPLIEALGPADDGTQRLWSVGNLQRKIRTTRMDADLTDGERMALALGALQGRVQRLQTARKDAVAERTVLEARADHLDAALDAVKMAAEDRKRRAAVRAAKERRACAVAATFAVEREVAVLEGRVAAQHEAFSARKPRPAPAPPTETPPPPPGSEDYRACLARASANAKDATDTLALARAHARTVTT